MKRELISMLVCPNCKGELTLKSFQIEKDNITDGLLLCERCISPYPIVNRIPRMLKDSTYDDVKLLKKYEKVISEYLTTREGREKIAKFDQLQKETIDKFSLEWNIYSTYGWDDPVYNIEYERQVFHQKTLFEPWEFKNKIILDAGCGNGRYLYWASQYGAKMAIGIDIGRSVDIAQQNLRNVDNVQLVQCDIFNLPFKEYFFDIIFTIGVLHHTGDARKATESLASCLKQGGKISVHVYHKSNAVYEKLDALIRRYTTKLSIDESFRFTKRLYALAKILYELRIGHTNIGQIINGFILRIDNHPHCIYDWYTAPIATHHVYEEVYKWFSDLSIEVIADQNLNKGFLKEIIKPLKLLVVKGQKNQARKGLA